MKAEIRAGFSMVELMVVVTTIGILALMAMPGIRMAHNRTEATVIANDLRVLSEAVEFYSTATGGYPDDMSSESMPPDVAEYLPSAWQSGVHNWFYANSKNYTYLYLSLNLTAEQAVHLDRIIDDGNITTGDVRIANNGNGLIYLFRYAPPRIDSNQA